MYKELLPFTTEYANNTKNSGMEWGKFETDTQKAGKLFRHSTGNMSCVERNNPFH